MILSRSARCTSRIFLTSLGYCKTPSCNIHVLCVRPRLHAVTPAFTADINQIIARFDSTEAASKDVILHIPEGNKSTVTSTASDGLPDIPAVESSTFDIPELISEVIVPLNKLGEPTLQSYGLGSYWTPAGWLQHLVEWFHCTLDLPWWASISVCIVIARLLMFPLVIKTQRSSIKMSNVMPEMQDIQQRMQNARNYGNDVEAMHCAIELNSFMKENKISPVGSFAMPLLQAPVFLSFFIGLRAMANAPVESFKQGGLFWFQDLTLPDPFYILPAATSATLYLTIKKGIDFQRMPSGSNFGRHLPKFLTLVPVLIFPFIMHFPSAVCVYWATTNVVSLGQVLFLKIPRVRKYFNIEEAKKMPPKNSDAKKEGFVKGIKSSFSNMKIAREIAERDRMDEMSFRKAGRAPPAKTFKENPLLKEERVAQAKKN